MSSRNEYVLHFNLHPFNTLPGKHLHNRIVQIIDCNYQRRLCIYFDLPTASDENPLSAGRSATIVAAYLMYSQNIDVPAALELIKKVRPTIQYVISRAHSCILALMILSDPTMAFSCNWRSSTRLRSRCRDGTKLRECSI